MHSLTLAPHSSSRGCYGHISFKFSFKLIPSKNDEAEVLMFVGFRMVFMYVEAYCLHCMCFGVWVRPLGKPIE